MKTDIAYIVSHGFAARMVMQTNLLGLLVESGKRVALIAPDKSDINLFDYCQERGVDLYEFNPHSGFWNSEYQFARKYFLEDIEKNPALFEKHIYATRFNKSNNPWKHIRPRILYLVYRLVKKFPGIKDWFQKREQGYLHSQSANQLLNIIQPKILVSTYPVNFSEAMLLKAAKKLNSKTIIHLLSWDNITCKGHFPQLADEYIAWGPIMKEELIEYYQIPEKNIHICGVPHFDIHLKSRENPKPQPYLENLGLDPNKPYLFFGMSSPRFAPREIDIVEWLAAEVLKNNFGNEMQLVIRPHPQNVQGSMADTSWLPRLQAIQGDRIAVDYPDLVTSKMKWSMNQKDMERLSHLLAGCTVSINSGSTLSIDALMCGVPVILTSFDGNEQLDYWRSARRLIDYIHLKKLVSLGGITIANDFNDFKNNLFHYLEHNNYNLKNRINTIEMQCQNYKDNATVNCLMWLNKFNELDC